MPVSSGFIHLIFITMLKQCVNGIHDHELSRGSKIHVTESITALSIVKNALLASALVWTVSYKMFNICFCLLFLTCLPSDFSFSLLVLHSKPEIILSTSTFIINSDKTLQNLPDEIVRMAKY